MPGWGDTRLANGNTARLGNLFRDLGTGQHAAMTRLGALAELDLDHFDLRVLCDILEARRIKAPVPRAASEIAGSDFPDQVCAACAVVA